MLYKNYQRLVSYVLLIGHTVISCTCDKTNHVRPINHEQASLTTIHNLSHLSPRLTGEGIPLPSVPLITKADTKQVSSSHPPLKLQEPTVTSAEQEDTIWKQDSLFFKEDSTILVPQDLSTSLDSLSLIPENLTYSPKQIYKDSIAYYEALLVPPYCLPEKVNPLIETVTPPTILPVLDTYPPSASYSHTEPVMPYEVSPTLPEPFQQPLPALSPSLSALPPHLLLIKHPKKVALLETF